MRKSLAFALFAAILVVAGVFIFHKWKQDRTPPNLVLITIDTLRADRCSTYGYSRETTPRMTQLASSGTLFREAYAPMPTTGPSHSTMFTSLYPIAHNVLKNGFVLGEQYETLAEILLKRGATTGAVVSSFAVKAKFGLGQGFLQYNDDFKGSNSSIRVKTWEGQHVDEQFDRRADETTQLAIQWLQQQKKGGRPFFLWVHYFDPHFPYDPPPEFRKRFPSIGQDETSKESALYDGEVAFTDQQMGILLDSLDQLGLQKKTLVVVTSDHGEGLNQHGTMHHGRAIYEEAVKVPLIFRWPGRIPVGKTIQGPVELVDLAPTILSFLQVPVQNRNFHGIALNSFILDSSRSAPQDRSIFMQRRQYEKLKGEKFAVRRGDWKLILAKEEGTTELFNLRDDPVELKNLADEKPEKVQELTAQLESWIKKYRNRSAPQPGISKEDEEALKSLGYVQ